MIAGEFLADNGVYEIFLSSNAVPSSVLPPILMPNNPLDAANTPTYFAFDAVSDPGLYQLNFVVQNFNSGDPNPVGLDVGAVPEPATWAMMIIGFLGLAFVGYRKSSTAPMRC